jgi:hypothetical protein
MPRPNNHSVRSPSQEKKIPVVLAGNLSHYGINLPTSGMAVNVGLYRLLGSTALNLAQRQKRFAKEKLANARIMPTIASP